MKYVLSYTLVMVLLACSGCAALQPISTDDKTLSDKVSATMWVRKISSRAGSREKTVKVDGALEEMYGSELVYSEALGVITRLNRDKYAGYSDWRLPAISEMKRLVEIADTSLESTNRDQKQKHSKVIRSKSYGLLDVGYYITNKSCWTSDVASENEMWTVWLGANSYTQQKRQAGSLGLVCPVRSASNNL